MMRFTDKQRKVLVKQNIDPNALINPKQKLPEYSSQIEKIVSYLRYNPEGEKAKAYKSRLKEILKLTNASLWKRIKVRFGHYG